MSQNRNNDYDLENASGATFRAELNKLLADIKTMNAASGEPVTPIEGQLFYDTDTNIVSIYDGTSFVSLFDVDTQDWIGGIPAGGVTSTELGSSSVTNSKIENDAVTFAKLDNVTAGNAQGRRTISNSSSTPTGGSIGDIVYQYD